MGRRKALPSALFPATIETLAQDGRGVSHLDGKAIFLHGGLPGEQVHFRYTKRQRRFDEGEVVEILTPSPDRVEPHCPHFGVCGGCSLQHLHPARQIEVKQQILLDALHHIGKLPPPELLPPLRMESPWGYRRKARLGVKDVPKKGKVLVGFRERGSPYIADLERCPVLDPRIGERLRPLGELVAGLTLRRHLPQFEVAIGEAGCILVARILQPLSPADHQALLAFGERHQIRFWTQAGGPESLRPLVAEEEEELHYALPEFAVTLHFRPDDFTQVNDAMNRQMVSRAVALLDPQPEERLLDLFCGLGNFTLPLARRAAAVVGVEGDPGLVERARHNAERNGLHNIDYYSANLYAPLGPQAWQQQTFHKALLDPPRSGAAEILPLLPKLGVQRLLYISCYPATLARDAGELVHTLGYTLRSAGVMDMFPHTAHVESIALFEKG